MSNAAKTAFLVALLMPMETVSAEQPAEGPRNQVVIGVLDEGAKTENFMGIEFEAQNFVPESEKPNETSGRIFAHGKIVGYTAAVEVRKIDPNVSVKIKAANIFYTSPSGGRNYDLNQTLKAIDWFKKSGVKIVNMSFVARDTEKLRTIVEYAGKNGMVIVAGTPNHITSEMKFPAAYTTTISVSGIAPGLPITEGKLNWADFAIDGRIQYPEPNQLKDEIGSSVAAAKVSGILGYYAKNRAEITKAEMVEFLTDSSKRKVVTYEQFQSAKLQKKSNVIEQSLIMQSMQSRAPM